MKKSIFMTLMSFLFLISCTPTDKSGEETVLSSESVDSQEIAESVEQLAKTTEKITKNAEQSSEQEAEATEQVAESSEQEAEPTKLVIEPEPREQVAEVTEQVAEPAEQVAESTEQEAEATEQVAEATEPAEQVFEPVKQAPIFQECRSNLRSALWRCTKGEDVVEYFLNQRPSHVDEEGTDRERIRICELHAVAGDREPSSEGEIVTYAHWEKDHCTNRLNEEVSTIQEEGFVCESTELFDEDRADEACPSAS